VTDGGGLYQYNIILGVNPFFKIYIIYIKHFYRITLDGLYLRSSPCKLKLTILVIEQVFFQNQGLILKYFMRDRHLKIDLQVL